MPKGETTTIRESGKPEQHWHLLIKRNASPAELMQAQVRQVGQTFHADCATYRITEVYLDEIKRLIAVGDLEEANV